MKVLIVDDSPQALALARVRLGKEGLTIACANDGKEGLEMAARERPDLILLDVDMPGLTGFEVCRALKADDELRMIPVIFLSGSATTEDKVMGLDLGAVDYVAKPFDGFELRARVNAALRTKRLQDLLVEHAMLDPLTGLTNRRGMMERLGHECARVQRHGGALSFVMADIDHFKRINDTYGHSAGDRALCEVAAAIAYACRQTDLPCRFGGEEFAIVVPDEAASGATSLAERCRKGVEALRIRAGAEAICATASFGVANVAADCSPDSLIQRADAALYRAKNAGRNRVEVSDEP